jgi:YVTN family beta-propeller protein
MGSLFSVCRQPRKLATLGSVAACVAATVMAAPALGVTLPSYTVTAVGNNAGLTSPFGAVLSSNGKTLYVANYLAHAVEVIPTADPTASTSIAFASTVMPVALALSPNGDTLYVAEANSGSGAVALVDVSGDGESGTVTGTISAGLDSPAGLAATSNGQLLYVSNSANNTVSVVDVSGDANNGKAIGTLSDPPASWTCRRASRSRRTARLCT